jgi:hypothetical protein
MQTSVFNACLLLGWGLVLVGGIVLNPGAGLLGAGLLLIALAMLGAKIGGLYVAEPDAAPQQGEGA